MRSRITDKEMTTIQSRAKLRCDPVEKLITRLSEEVKALWLERNGLVTLLMEIEPLLRHGAPHERDLSHRITTTLRVLGSVARKPEESKEES